MGSARGGMSGEAVGRRGMAGVRTFGTFGGSVSESEGGNAGRAHEARAWGHVGYDEGGVAGYARGEGLGGPRYLWQGGASSRAAADDATGAAGNAAPFGRASGPTGAVGHRDDRRADGGARRQYGNGSEYEIGPYDNAQSHTPSSLSRPWADAPNSSAGGWGVNAAAGAGAGVFPPPPHVGPELKCECSGLQCRGSPWTAPYTSFAVESCTCHSESVGDGRVRQ